jgi:hypothetical protein
LERHTINLKDFECFVQHSVKAGEYFPMLGIACYLAWLGITDASGLSIEFAEYHVLFFKRKTIDVSKSNGSTITNGSSREK